jgi:predicted SprT family Zn-dependent metalloprotease
MHPTTELYASLQLAYGHFNEALFGGTLPEVIFTVQRQKGVMGYFAPERWGNLSGNKCHEIAINPSYIANCRLIEVMQTLVHEMVHCWQHCCGTPGRSYYHNKEWAMKMISIGLMPSSTGEPGGTIIGQHMGDYIIEGGAFLTAFNDLASSKQFQLTWIDRKALPRLFEPIIANPDAPTPIEIPMPTEALALLAQSPEIAGDQNVSLIAHHLEPSHAVFSQLMPHLILDEEPARKTRYRYICYGCMAKVYGKPKLNIRCDDCNQLFECEAI